MTENTDTLSPEVLADLKAKAEKATPGPWATVDPMTGMIHVVSVEGTPVCYLKRADRRGLREERYSTSEFIAAANPARVLSLLTALEEAQSGLHGVMEAGRQEIALLRARAEKAEQMAAAKDEALRYARYALVQARTNARDTPESEEFTQAIDEIDAALSHNKSEADQ